MVLEHFIEPDRDVQRRGLRGLVLDLQVAEERSRRDRHVPHTPFDEIAGGRRFGEDHEIGGRLELRDLCQHAADLLEIGGIIALLGAELCNRDAGHVKKILRR